MSTIMSQVTCSLRNIKIDGTKWNEHLVSVNHLQFCKDNKNKLAIKFFEMIFNACPKKNTIYNFKIAKPTISGSYIFQQNYQKKNLIYYAVIESTIQF